MLCLMLTLYQMTFQAILKSQTNSQSKNKIIRLFLELWRTHVTLVVCCKVVEKLCLDCLKVVFFSSPVVLDGALVLAGVDSCSVQQLRLAMSSFFFKKLTILGSFALSLSAASLSFRFWYPLLCLYSMSHPFSLICYPHTFFLAVVLRMSLIAKTQNSAWTHIVHFWTPNAH